MLEVNHFILSGGKRQYLRLKSNLSTFLKKFTKKFPSFVLIIPKNLKETEGIPRHSEVATLTVQHGINCVRILEL